MPLAQGPYGPILIDVTRIAPRLWIGGAPQPGRRVADAGFDVLVLAAKEYQPGAANWPGLKRIIACPIDDAVLSYDEAGAVEQAAQLVASEVAAGRRVLVTCAAGRNRSGVILARALVLQGFAPAFVIALIQKLRAQALTNESFVRWLVSGRLADVSAMFERAV